MQIERLIVKISITVHSFGFLDDDNANYLEKKSL